MFKKPKTFPIQRGQKGLHTGEHNTHLRLYDSTFRGSDTGSLASLILVSVLRYVVSLADDHVAPAITPLVPHDVPSSR